ncbi:hypothetical protein FHG87_010866 [Trinorchestia longiramus]|nr:hypothetical protein FHG87_010866 [Trinorchestia longiramus]
MEGVRPPLPPKAVEGGKDMPPPQPPPRRNKRSFLGSTNLRKDQLHSGSLASLRQNTSEKPLSTKPPAPPPPVRRPEQLYSHAQKKSTSGSTEGPLSEGGEGARTTIMSSLKRFMGSRPLPAPPTGASKGQPDGGGALHSNLIRSLTSPDLANDENEPALAVAIPQTVVDLTHEDQRRGDRPPAYPPLPRPPASSAGMVDAQNKINSVGHQRKFSLQQPSLQRDEKRTRNVMVVLARSCGQSMSTVHTCKSICTSLSSLPLEDMATTCLRAALVAGNRQLAAGSWQLAAGTVGIACQKHRSSPP